MDVVRRRGVLLVAYLKRIRYGVPSFRIALKRRLREASDWFGDATKAFVILVVLRPSADFLPRRVTFALARFFGYLHASTPYFGRKTYLHVRRTIEPDSREAKRLTASILSRHFLDFVVLRRYLRGREVLETWPLEESNVHLVEDLRSSGASYLVAAAHVSRSACLPMYLPRSIPQTITTIINPPLVGPPHPRTLWLRAHFGQMLNFLERVRPDMQLIHPGDASLFRKLLRRLKQPGNVVTIYPDAPWDKEDAGTLVRAFAGRKIVQFATGAARLGRLARCPIVLCLPYLNERGKVIIDWVAVVPPPDSDDSAADVANTNILLDHIECAVGMRPDQYVIDFLGERHWDSQTKRWEDGV